MALPPVADLAVFMGLVLVLSLYGLTVSGHFPAEHRAETLRSASGAMLLWGTLALSVALVAVAVLFAARRLPVYASVLGGGAMLLVAPLLLQPFPDAFVNGRRGLLTFAALGLGLTLIATLLLG